MLIWRLVGLSHSFTLQKVHKLCYDDGNLFVYLANNYE